MKINVSVLVYVLIFCSTCHTTSGKDIGNFLLSLPIKPMALLSCLLLADTYDLIISAGCRFYELEYVEEKIAKPLVRAIPVWKVIIIIPILFIISTHNILCLREDFLVNTTVHIRSLVLKHSDNFRKWLITFGSYG